jgi:hypothetical protein
MSIRISAFRNRLRVDTSAREGIREELNGSNPFFWNGSAVQFEIGLFRKEDLVDDLSNIAGIVLEVKSLADKTGPALMSVTLTALDILGSLTLEEWDGGAETNCHAKASFGSDDATLNLGGTDTKDFWLVIAAIRNDGENVTLGCSAITVQEDGSSATASAAAGSNFRFNQSYPEIKYDDATWHRIKPVMIEGQYDLDVEQVASGQLSDAVSDHWRTNGGFPELKWDNASWHQLTPLIDAEGHYVLDVTPAAAGAFVQNADHFRINLGFAEWKFPDNTWHRLKSVMLEGQYTLDIEQTQSP